MKVNIHKLLKKSLYKKKCLLKINYHLTLFQLGVENLPHPSSSTSLFSSGVKTEQLLKERKEHLFCRHLKRNLIKNKKFKN
jgi:hypothetical protein